MDMEPYNDFIHWVIISKTSVEIVSSMEEYSREEPVLQGWNR